MKPSKLGVAGLALTAALAAVGAVALTRSQQPGPAVPIHFETLYSSVTERGATYAKASLELRGQPVVISGYAAADPAIPDRFVLTQAPKTLCSPCDESADYPSSITVIFPKADTEAVAVATDSLFVTLERNQTLPRTGMSIRVRGQLELRQQTDSVTRFSSLVQLRNATWAPLATP